MPEPTTVFDMWSMTNRPGHEDLQPHQMVTIYDHASPMRSMSGGQGRVLRWI